MISKLKVAVLDLGLWVEDAVRIARDVAQVYYSVPNQDAFQEPFKGKIGMGLEGIQVVKVDEWWNLIDKVDLIYIPDNTCAGVVEFLKKHGYPVAGVGMAERLEIDRWYGRVRQRDNDMPVQASLLIEGVSALSELMQNGGGEFGFPEFPKEFYVKVDNEYRGVEESFKHTDWASSESTVLRIAARLGPFKEDIKFICEELLDGSEPGLDGITWEGDLMFPTMGGYEGKGVGIIERVYQKPEDLPDAYRRIDKGLSPEFAKYKTRFFYSVEMKIGRDRVPYLIDPTMRKAGPGTSALQAELIDNFTEVVYGLATGNRVNPKMKYKYGAACAFHSEEAVKDWVRINMSKDMRQWVKLRMAAKKEGKYYAVPGFDSLGTVIGLSNTVGGALALVKDRMEEIKVKRIDTGIEKLEDITKDIEEGRKRGVEF